MERIGRILGKTAHASITFSAQRHLQIVELTVQARTQTIAATGKANALDAALRQAIPTLKTRPAYRDRKMEQAITQRRKGADRAAGDASQIARCSAGRQRTASWQTAKARASIAVHSFPSGLRSLNRTSSRTARLSLYPMTIEEAVKEAEFRDRDLLIFHTSSGEMFVLHRRRDGQMELIELPSS